MSSDSFENQVAYKLSVYITGFVIKQPTSVDML